MDQEDLNEKRVMHVDTSCKLYENKNTGIACRTIDSQFHRGLALSRKLKRELKRDLSISKDYAKIYAICIYYLIKDNLDIFDVLVICGDENYSNTKKHLDLLFGGNKKYAEKKIISLYELRKITGKKRLKSHADNLSRSYRRRALKSIGRRQKNVPLNVIEVNYKSVKSKWNELERKKCK